MNLLRAVVLVAFFGLSFSVGAQEAVVLEIPDGALAGPAAEADNYGINVSGQPDGFARVAMRLSEYRKISPGSLE